MKNIFHNDIENDNLDIANKILNDSEKINTKNIVDEKLLNEIKNNKIIPKKKLSGKRMYAFASAVAACVVLIIGIAYFNDNKDTESSGTFVIHSESEYSTGISESSGTAPASFTTASDYSEIYTRMKVASTTINVSYGAKDALEDSFSNSASTAKSMDADRESAANSDTNYYDTNEQTQNVHEGDIVKTDGQYIYTLTYNDKKETYKIIITKADGMNLEKMSVITFKKSSLYDETIQEIYVSENKLVAVGTRYTNILDNSMLNSAKYSTACYDIGYWADNETVIYTYDISDRKQPEQICENIQDGDYISSRMNDGFLYTISDKNMYSLTKDKCVPSINGKLMPYDCIYLPTHIEEQRYTVITALNINDSETFCDSLAVAGGTSTLYASHDHLYLINNITDEKEISDTSSGKKAMKNTDIKIFDHKKVKLDRSTKKSIQKYFEDIDVDSITAYKDTGVYKYTDNIQIFKYNYNGDKIEFVADTTVDGSSYDNLNFDEKDGYLRFVTTENSETYVETRINYYDKNRKLLFHTNEDSDMGDTEEETSNIFVLDQDLNVKAEINNIAKGESIYSSRFFGNYGYFVTYENTDPLFSVDFSDIENPKIIGKLKLPGFSDYLHFYTDNKLFGLGVDTDAETGNWESLKLEMYDVSDGKASQEAKLIIEDYDYAEALDNYKALMIDSEKGLIGFAAATYSDTPNTYLLYTYKNKKFKKLVEIELDQDYDIRGFYINDYLYIVDPNSGIRVLNLKTYGKDKKVEFEKF